MTPQELDALGQSLAQEETVSIEDKEQYDSYMNEILEVMLEVRTRLEELIPQELHSDRIKHIESVISKLQRKPGLKLSEMSDLAGFRIITQNRQIQQQAVETIKQHFDTIEVDDKTDNPKSGYRAVHIDINVKSYKMEIQIQTKNQADWQMISETAAGFDRNIKYGEGSPEVSRALIRLSEIVLQYDIQGLKLPEEKKEGTRRTIRNAYSQKKENTKCRDYTS